MSRQIKFRCCICNNVVELRDADGNVSDAYSLQLQKIGEKSPEMVWAHGPCLRKVMPVVGEEIPGPQHNV
jgi:hypothetical protein